jgi:hypothetical protein
VLRLGLLFRRLLLAFWGFLTRWRLLVARCWLLLACWRLRGGWRLLLAFACWRLRGGWCGLRGWLLTGASGGGLIGLDILLQHPGRRRRRIGRLLWLVGLLGTRWLAHGRRHQRRRGS